MKPMIQRCINDYLTDDLHPLKGLIDWLLIDKQIPIERIYKIAWTQFSIPRNIVRETILSLM